MSMTKEEIKECLESQFWKECLAYLNEEINSCQVELCNLNYLDTQAAFIAHGIQQKIEGIKEVNNFIEKIEREVMLDGEEEEG